MLESRSVRKRARRNFRRAFRESSTNKHYFPFVWIEEIVEFKFCNNNHLSEQVRREEIQARVPVILEITPRR